MCSSHFAHRPRWSAGGDSRGYASAEHVGTEQRCYDTRPAENHGSTPARQRHGTAQRRRIDPVNPHRLRSGRQTQPGRSDKLISKEPSARARASAPDPSGQHLQLGSRIATQSPAREATLRAVVSRSSGVRLHSDAAVLHCRCNAHPPRVPAHETHVTYVHGHQRRCRILPRRWRPGRSVGRSKGA